MSKYQKDLQISEAVYSRQERVIYEGNPCIEALPENRSDEIIYKEMDTKIPLDDIHCAYPDYLRKQGIQELEHIFIPIGQAIDVARKIDTAIREGYVSRNPLGRNWKSDIGELQRAVRKRDQSFSNVTGVNANACGFCIIGDSGMGKTSIVKHALSSIPQLIEHSSYYGTDFRHSQITWMNLECPSDASIKGLCIEFFSQYDEIMGENTREQFATGRSNTDEMVARMALIARSHSLGLLVIDEIQNLSSGRSGGAQRLRNLIVQLVNSIGIPVLLVGTPSALAVLSTDLKTIRRACGQQGMSMIEPLGRDTMDWDNLTYGIWDYQWTNEKAERTPEILDAIYRHSLGNIDATIKLYMEAQRVAIDKGAAKITPAIINEAAKKESFILVFKRLKEEQISKAKVFDGYYSQEKTKMIKVPKMNQPEEKEKEEPRTVRKNLNKRDIVKDYDYKQNIAPSLKDL